MEWFRQGTSIRTFRYQESILKRLQRLTAAAICISAAGLFAQEVGKCQLTMPAAVDRTETVPIEMSFEHAHTGAGDLHITWTDSLNRVVLDRTVPVRLTDEIRFSFPLDLSLAVAMQNTLEAHLTLKDKTKSGEEKIVEERASTAFVAKPVQQGWEDYVILMYQHYPTEIHKKMREVGINGGQWVGRNHGTPEGLVENNLRWYSENLATDFYAEYHRWKSDRPVNESYVRAKELYSKDPTSKEAFKRHPSFWDPEWRKKIHDRVVDVVTRNDPYKPYFYSLSDESGIADLGAQWDFDLSDFSLAQMRRWLQTRYGTLDALNAEWETNFATWDLVTPLTTQEAMDRKGENFAPWADFKEWMDISYADALKMGVDAAHEVDPHAYVGIVGAQKPGWGGYDYSRLTRAVNVMEPYDIGASVKLSHSLDPQIPLLSTTFASGDWERHRVWYELLQGNRGLILWDENQEYIRKDGTKGKAGAAAESQYNELLGGMGSLIMNSTPEDDGIAIHYSQASMRTAWMLERRPDGAEWAKRDAQYERSHNDFMRLRESWGHIVEDQGLQYNFVSYLQVQEGELLKRGYRMLILPDSNSLSHEEADQIRSFVHAGGVVVADQLPGTYDEHSRKLTASPLADLFEGGAGTGAMKQKIVGKGKAILVNAKTLEYLQDRITGKEAKTLEEMSDLMNASGMKPRIVVGDVKHKPEVGLIVRTFRNGGVKLLSIQTNPQQRVDELGPPDFKSNSRFGKEMTGHVALPKAMYVYDTRAMKSLGRVTSLTVKVDPYEPTIYTLSEEALPKLNVAVSEMAKLGSRVEIALNENGASSQTQVYHVQVIDPSGKETLQYSQNVVAHDGAAVLDIPLAVNDASGEWAIKVRNLLSGEVITRSIHVQ
jgi:hypothetical protein